jgi:hypothetical protein
METIVIDALESVKKFNKKDLVHIFNLYRIRQEIILSGRDTEEYMVMAS